LKHRDDDDDDDDLMSRIWQAQVFRMFHRNGGIFQLHVATCAAL